MGKITKDIAICPCCKEEINVFHAARIEVIRPDDDYEVECPNCLTKLGIKCTSIDFYFTAEAILED